VGNKGPAFVHDAPRARLARDARRRVILRINRRSYKI